VVLRNDASPLDGDNKRLVCVRGDQCHDHMTTCPKPGTSKTGFGQVKIMKEFV
jgi:hypothetical protein